MIAAAARDLGAADSIGTIVNTSGVAQIERSGALLAAMDGTIVQDHDKLNTAPGASLTLEFSDGSSITLGESSSVELEDRAAVAGKPVSNRVTLLSGSLHTAVPDKNSGLARTIEVDTPIPKTLSSIPPN